MNQYYAKFDGVNEDDLNVIAANLPNANTKELWIQNTTNPTDPILSRGVFSILDGLSNNTNLEYLFFITHIDSTNDIHTNSQPTKDNTTLEHLTFEQIDHSFIKNLAPYLKSFKNLKSFMFFTGNQELNCTDIKRIIEVFDHKYHKLRRLDIPAI